LSGRTGGSATQESRVLPLCFRFFLSDSSCVQEPNHWAGGLESSGWIRAGFGAGFAAKGREYLALVFPGYQKKRVQSAVQNHGRERQASWRSCRNFDGCHPPLLFFEGGRTGKKRGGVTFDAQTLEVQIKRRVALNQKTFAVPIRMHRRPQRELEDRSAPGERLPPESARGKSGSRAPCENC
jgi:hypothetical protein